MRPLPFPLIWPHLHLVFVLFLLFLQHRPVAGFQAFFNGALASNIENFATTFELSRINVGDGKG